LVGKEDLAGLTIHEVEPVAHHDARRLESVEQENADLAVDDRLVGGCGLRRGGGRPGRGRRRGITGLEKHTQKDTTQKHGEDGPASAQPAAAKETG